MVWCIAYFGAFGFQQSRTVKILISNSKVKEIWPGTDNFVLSCKKTVEENQGIKVLWKKVWFLMAQRSKTRFFSYELKEI